MTNYDKEIIVRILGKSPHNDKGYYREYITHSTKSVDYRGNGYIGDYHKSTNWRNLLLDTLKTRVYKLVLSGYEFDNHCCISRKPNFKGRRIL